MKEHFWKTKGKFQGKKRVLLENKRAILEIEGHFWEAKEHIELRRIKTLATLQPPPPPPTHLKRPFLDI